MFKQYESGDILETPTGLLLFVQCPLPFSGGNLAGKTLYWVQDGKDEDLMYFDYELAEMNVKNLTEG